MNPCFKIGKFFWKAAGEKSFHSCSSLCLAGSYGKVEAGQGKVLQCKETQCANEQASAGNFIVDSLKSSWWNLDVAIQLFIVSLTTEKLLLRWGKCTWFWSFFFFFHFSILKMNIKLVVPVLKPSCHLKSWQCLTAPEETGQELA